MCALFADDVNILVTNKNKQLAEESAERSMDTVFELSREWKLSLNAAKSESVNSQRWQTMQSWSPCWQWKDYAAPGWQPWISANNMEELERAQNWAFRIITGQVQSAPLEAV